MDQELETGTIAPAFSLPNNTNSPVTLDDFKGSWVVLYFYPKNDTPGCTTQAKDFTQEKEEFTSLNAKVIGISPDSAESHSKFIHKHSLDLALLSDPKKEVHEDYNVLKKRKFIGKFKTGTNRSTFIINPDGEIAKALYGVKAEGHVLEVLEILRELQSD